jgi:N-acetyl-alpha-D-muramate 1-phosphate uridylyltransferase
MLLAAGLGRRMMPLTQDRPKALVEVRGVPLIDWALERLEHFGIDHIAVNLYSFAPLLEAHLRRRWHGKLDLSHEEKLLDTGGGIRACLPYLGSDPFFAINADTIWLDGAVSALERMTRAFDPEQMDALLLCSPVSAAVGYTGSGDFLMGPDGRLRRRPEREQAPFVFASVQLLHPRLFEGSPEGPFSMNLLFNRAIQAGRFFGIRHEAEWFEVGTKAAVEQAEQVLDDLGFRKQAA